MCRGTVTRSAKSPRKNRCDRVHAHPSDACPSASQQPPRTPGHKAQRQYNRASTSSSYTGRIEQGGTTCRQAGAVAHHQSNSRVRGNGAPQPVQGPILLSAQCPTPMNSRNTRSRACRARLGAQDRTRCAGTCRTVRLPANHFGVLCKLPPWAAWRRALRHGPRAPCRCVAARVPRAGGAPSVESKLRK